MGENMKYLNKAKELMPKLYKSTCRPLYAVKLFEDKNCLHNLKLVEDLSMDQLYKTEMQEGSSFILDFGKHIVGRFTIKARPSGHQQDSPLRLKLTFAEMPCELIDKEYHVGLSSTWVQDEIINIDAVALPYNLARRYAFRYVKVEIIGRNYGYRVYFEDLYANEESSSDIKNVSDLPQGTDPLLVEIDRIALRTLQNCSQDVFEDGPKRDRRLWLGDLRLQAITDYLTFNNTDLSKRCLYLFAGLPHANGQVSSCIFHEPTLKNDSWILNDYSLFFISTLYDYYKHTNDMDFLREMWESAFKQAEIVSQQIDEKGLAILTPTNYHIDWCLGLDKHASAQGVCIYAFKQALEIAKILGDTGREIFLKEKIDLLTEGALNHLYNNESKLFESGEDKQISWHSQIWMVLAKVFDKEENTKLLQRVIDANPKIKSRTPYMYHHFIQALIDCDLKDLALHYLKEYWGAMVDLKADTFWEAFDPDDLYLSPYSSIQTNSYCHAWSCTPSYFIRKYFI